MSVTQAAPGIAVEVECSSKEGGEGGRRGGRERMRECGCEEGPPGEWVRVGGWKGTLHSYT